MAFLHYRGLVQLLERLEALSMPWAIVTSGSVPVARARHAAGELATLEILYHGGIGGTRQTKP